MAEEHFPGIRILGRRRMGYIVVPRSRLHGSARNKDPGDAGEDAFVATQDFDYADTLGALLKAYLPAGYPSARLAASLMDVSVRTLARRLSDCGATYRAVIDQLRFNAARKLLQDTDVRITDVAIAVGFDDSTNFARMFRRIGGLSPLQFRRATRSLRTGALRRNVNRARRASPGHARI